MITQIVVPDALQRLIHDVRTHQLPALLGQASSDGTRGAELSDEEHDLAERELLDTQHRIEYIFAEWSMDAIDLGNNARERDAWARLVHQTKDDVSRLKKETQQAVLDSHRMRQERKIKERAMHWRRQQSSSSSRDALFGEMSETQGERNRRKEGRLADQTSDDKLMTASGDVTAALQRTVKLMSAELEKSSYSAQLLDESTVSVQQATVQYTSFSDLVASSRKLIASMERADLVDAIILGLSMLFFASCILYILKVRIWDRGIGILSFLARLVGVTKSRSAADVSEKLRMAAEAAKSQSTASSLASVKSAASKASAAIASSLASAASATPSADLHDAPQSSANIVDEAHAAHDEL